MVRIEPEFFLSIAVLLHCRQERSAGEILIFLVLHELGHALLYRLGGGRLRRVTLGGFGIRMEMGTPPRKWEWEVLAVAGGPGINLVAAAVAFAAGYCEAGAAGMLLGLYNLFPAHFLDGGLLVEQVAEHAGIDGSKITRVGSVFLCLILLGLFLTAIFRGIFPVGLFFTVILAIIETFTK